MKERGGRDICPVHFRSAPEIRESSGSGSDKFRLAKSFWRFLSSFSFRRKINAALPDSLPSSISKEAANERFSLTIDGELEKKKKVTTFEHSS